MDKRICRKCGMERYHLLDGFSSRGDKVFRDEHGTRWYNAVCGYCQYQSQRTCPHCKKSMAKRQKKVIPLQKIS